MAAALRRAVLGHMRVGVAQPISGSNNFKLGRYPDFHPNYRPFPSSSPHTFSLSTFLAPHSTTLTLSLPFTFQNSSQNFTDLLLLDCRAAYTARSRLERERSTNREREMSLLRSLCRSSSVRSSLVYSAVAGNRILTDPLRSQAFSTIPRCSTSPLSKRAFLDSRSSFVMATGSIRTFSVDISHYPDIKDPKIKIVFKDFMAADWGDLPVGLITEALDVLSKPTDDSSGKEVLKNVFRAAEAVEEFTGTLETLKMELDDSVGLSGENVKPLPADLVSALVAAYDRYMKYLDSFGPDEVYLKKKVETQLGSRMIHLKMRCSGLGSEWGKVSVLGTSGISGSYVEQRAP